MNPDKKKKRLFRIEKMRDRESEKFLVTLLQYLDHSKYQVDLLLDQKNGI